MMPRRSGEYRKDCSDSDPEGHSLKPPPVGAHASDDLIGQTLDNRYHITDLLGKGGMSVVYKARHLVLDRVIALKVLSRTRSDVSSILRFQQEARALSALDHPTLVKVHAFGQTPDGNPYLVMDYASGQTISEIIIEDGALQGQLCLKTMREICAGVAHAHERGIIHRDLKPSNIIIDEKGDVKILDFGIAKLLPGSGKQDRNLTTAGATCGSPPYMSPEQCLGEQLDARSDIYSLGCVFYEMATGERPFIGNSSQELMLKHLNETAGPLRELNSSVPPALDKITRKCLEKDPANRYQTVAEIQQALEVVGTQSASEQAVIDMPICGEKFKRKRLSKKVTLALAAGAVIVTAAVIAGFLWCTVPGRIIRLEHTVKGLREAQDTVQLLPVTLELSHEYRLAGMPHKGIAAVDELLKIAGKRLDPYSPQYAGLTSKCTLELQKCEPSRGKTLYESSLKAWTALLMKYKAQNRYQEELIAANECINLCICAGHPLEAAQFYLISADVNARQNKLDQAEQQAQKAVDLCSENTNQSTKDQQGLLFASVRLSEILILEGKDMKALPHCLASVEMAKSLGANKDVYKEVLTNLVACYTHMRDFKNAEKTREKLVGL